MGDRYPGPICAEAVGDEYVDDGTMCLTRSAAPGALGRADESFSPSSEATPLESPGFLEELRRQAIIGSILGIRKALAAVNPMAGGPAMQAVSADETRAQALLAGGDYDRAFELATGFPEYFEIYRQGRSIGAPDGEIAAVMLGEATGFNQAVEAASGEARGARTMSGSERITTTVEAVLKLASTALTVAGGVQAGSALASSGRIVSPVYRVGRHDVVVVETTVGRQAFYRSTGTNSGNPGKWYPVDEFMPHWLNKGQYTQGPGLEKGNPLHRLGSEEFARISKKLGEKSIPRGHDVPGNPRETPEATMNRILDFFGARTTKHNVVRPLEDR